MWLRIRDGSMNEYAGRRPCSASSKKSSRSEKRVAKCFHSWVAWISPVIDRRMPGSTYTRQGRSAASSRSKMVAAWLCSGKFSYGVLITNPDELAAW